MERLRKVQSAGLLWKSKYGRWGRLVGQFTHFLVALGMLIVAIVEFSAERPLFDLLGKYADIPSEVEALFFQVTYEAYYLDVHITIDYRVEGYPSTL